jgi:UDP-2,3-diacylglucosamine pyrophosphatase LpxH
MTTRHYRTIWLSDLHLGTRGCQAEQVLDFLRHTESEHLYLVGDVVDGWALRQGWHWPQPHNDVIQKLLRKARKGTRVVYVPGNHDAFAREFVGLTFGEIEITREALHDTADERILLVLHGDEFDGAVKFAPWLSRLGARAYVAALAANTGLNRVRRWFGMEYWSLAGTLKARAKKAVQYVGKFEEAVARRARDRDVDGIICGHIHKAELRPIGGILYANCGDWVESCTALVEHEDGRLEIVRWPDLPGPEAAATPGDGLASGYPVLSALHAPRDRR